MLDDVLKKNKAGETLSETEQTLLDQFNAHAKGIRAGSDKQLEKLQAQIKELEGGSSEKAELEKELEAIKAKLEETESGKLSEVEKLTKSIETLQSGLQAEKTAREEAEKTAAETARAAKIDGLLSENKIGFVDGVSPTITSSAWRDAFSETDLSDPDAVKTVVDQFRKDNAGLIAAPSQGGAGTKPGAPGSPGKDFLDLSPAEQQKQVLEEFGDVI